MSEFQAARDAMEQGLSDTYPASDQSTQAPDTGGGSAQAQQEQRMAQAIAELDKMERFKFEGQEWTPQDLKKAILRQKDYTQKTQTLAEERKTFEKDSKFREGLVYDLARVAKNPTLVQEFLQKYPEQFHPLVENYLDFWNKELFNEQKQVQQQPQVDVATLSRLERLEKFYNEQEVQKNELQINQIMESMSAKYPNAANFKEMVLGRALELHSGGQKLDEGTWEDIFKRVDEQVDQTLKAKYGDFVKKQKEANAKGRDVGSGGGTATGAPKKFKNLGEVTKFAIEDLGGRR